MMLQEIVITVNSLYFSTKLTLPFIRLIQENKWTILKYVVVMTLIGLMFFGGLKVGVESEDFFGGGIHFLHGLKGEMWYFRLGFCLVCWDERSLVSKNEAFEILSVVKLILNWSTQKERRGISENNTLSWLCWNAGELFPVFLVWPITIYASKEVIECVQSMWNF